MRYGLVYPKPLPAGPIARVDSNTAKPVGLGVIMIKRYNIPNFAPHFCLFDFDETVRIR
jgi:hypothetical protein